MIGTQQRRRGASRDFGSRSTLLDLRPGLRALGALFSFEAVFIFFLISVNYKGDPRLAFVPIDLTVIFFVLGVAMGVAIIYREGVYAPGLILVSLLMVFIVWVMLTGLWTPSEIYAREKLLKLVTLNLWSVIATAMIMANRRERVRRFLLLVLVLGTAASLYGLSMYSGAVPDDTEPEAFSTDEAFSASFRVDNNVANARFYGMAALVAFGAWLYTTPSFRKRGLALTAAFAVCWFGLLVIGSRGPTLAVLASMMLPLALGLRFAGRRLFASKALVATFALLALLVAGILYGIAEYSGNLRTLQRLNILLTEEAGGQTRRLAYWTDSWTLWIEQPLFGSGVGSWPVRFHGRDISSYPHNLILEVMVEFGLIGLLLLAAFGVAAARHTSVHRLREDPLLMCAAMLCISAFLAAMTSSDITGNRNVFAMMGLLAMRPYARSSSVGSRSGAREAGSSESERPDLPRGVLSPGGGRT